MLIDLDETQAGNPHLPGVRLEGQGLGPKIGPKMAKNQVFEFCPKLQPYRGVARGWKWSHSKEDTSAQSPHLDHFFVKMHRFRDISPRSLKIFQKSKNSGCPQENPYRSRRELRGDMGSTVLESRHPGLQTLLRHFGGTVASRRDTGARTLKTGLTGRSGFFALIKLGKGPGSSNLAGGILLRSSIIVQIFSQPSSF